jgi:hypothetical protein
MSLCSSTENKNEELRHAGMDGRHPDAQDASGDVDIGLDSSSPCWNDGTETEPTPVFSRERTKAAKDSFNL